MPDHDGSTREWPYLEAAAAIADEQDDSEAAALLRESRIGEVHFSEPALIKENGQERVAIEVVLLHTEDVAPEVRERAAACMHEAVSDAGYQVRGLEVRVPQGG